MVAPDDAPSIPTDQPGHSIDLPTGNDGVSVTDGESDTDVDHDGDGLSLAEELYFGTSDLFADTDFDGLSDFDEIVELGTDPLSSDTDSDGLGDFDEVTIYRTSPSRSDSDFDGLSDSEEVRLFGTDPLSSDSDSDGLFDGHELDLGTDPLVQDTDRDGISDFDEWLGFTNPLDPNDPPPPIVPGDLFSFMTQDQADVLRSMQAAGNLRAGQEYARCQSRVQSDCASRGTLGSGTCQAALCSCERLGWELSIQAFEDAVFIVLEESAYAMTSEDREEVSDYMHARYDSARPCWLPAGGTATCAWVSSLCSW